MIDVKNLTKRYGAKAAVSDVSFTVSRGEIIGLLGPNGAGKTTIMNIITGYLSATDGTVTVNGHDIVTDPAGVKKCIGYLPEQPPLYLDMTVNEYLQFVYELKKVKLPYKEHLKEVKELARISDVADRLIRNLSKGYRQRVGLAQALIGNPEVLILDEPTVGLDPKQIIEMRSVIKDLGKERTVILSSHILPEISAVCERIIIINKGKIVATGSTDDLTKAVDKQNRFIARIKGDRQEVVSRLRGIEGLMRATPKSTGIPDVYDYSIECERDVREDMFYSLVEASFPLLGLRPKDMSLEDVFIKITSSDQILLEDEAAEVPEEEAPAEAPVETPEETPAEAPEQNAEDEKNSGDEVLS